MSSLSVTDNQLIETLTSATNQLNRYFSLFIFLFGITGNILNTVVLSQRHLRRNPCIFLFLISSISNLISILSGLPPRIMSGWDADITSINEYHCKLRAFIMFTSRTIAFWLIMLATVDRWILSSKNAQRRKLSTLKTIKKGILIILIITILLYLHMLYCYEANLIDAPLKFYGKTVSCRLLTDMTYACFTILIPLILMIIFGSMTISNIRATHSRRIIVKQNQNYLVIFANKQKRRFKKLDRYLRRMLLLQVILLILLTLPQIIHKLYSTLTLYEHRSPVEYSIDRFLYNFDLLLPYLESGTPLYIYTLSGGKVFRNTLKKLVFKRAKQILK